MGGEQLYFSSVSGPYGQLTAVKVKDHGNGLPIHIGCSNDDPPHAANNSLSVRDAELFHSALGKAIETAKEAGLT